MRFLGLDASTQSLTAVAIDLDTGRVVLDESVRFGADLPDYGCPQGFLPNTLRGIVHAPPLLWVEALDLLFARCQKAGFDFGSVTALSGAAQQHGTVYLRHTLDEARLRTDVALCEQVRPLLSRKTSPIWLDSSTGEECTEITLASGGPEVVARVTGSLAIERFAGPQIRKFFKQAPEAYAETSEIHLVSSFMASLLVNARAPIDHGDAAGMNLLDLSTLTWSEQLASATAPELLRKLPPAVPSTARIGNVADYFRARYGFAPSSAVYAFSGDNPSSLVGMGATEPGTVVVSLGTSDTVFAATREPRVDPRGYGHVFGNPAGGFMSLICFANGSLSRERVAERFAMSWEDFSRAILDETAPGNQSNWMLPFFVPEMTPKLRDPEVRLFGSEPFMAWEKPALTARAIVEAQALGMQRYSAYMGERPRRILVTGGGASNAGIRQVLADVFEAEVFTLGDGNSSALGAALRAAAAHSARALSELSRRFVAIAAEPAARPDPSARGAYDALRARREPLLSALESESS